VLGLGAKSRVDADLTSGKAISIGATPTLYINGVPYQFAEMQIGPLKAAVDAELKKMASPEAANTANAAPAADGNQNK